LNGLISIIPVLQHTLSLTPLSFSLCQSCLAQPKQQKELNHPCASQKSVPLTLSFSISPSLIDLGAPCPSWITCFSAFGCLQGKCLSPDIFISNRPVKMVSSTREEVSTLSELQILNLNGTFSISAIRLCHTCLGPLLCGPLYSAGEPHHHNKRWKRSELGFQ